MDTPAFLVWSLEYTCAVRGFESGRDPERIERLLRAARAASDATRDGRVFEGICLDPPHGFKFNEALDLYGGQAAVSAACRGCAANITASKDEGSWAGCFGMAPLPDVATVLEPRLRAAFESDASISWANHFVATDPAWYGLWLRSPLGGEPAAALASILTSIQNGCAFADLIAGLKAAATRELPFHFLHYPPGRVEQGWWRLVRHCPRCKAPWGDSGAGQCAVCGYGGAPAPDKKRRARGRRPYVAIHRLLGEAAAAEFLNRYENSKPPSPLDRVVAQKQPVPPGSRPDD